MNFGKLSNDLKFHLCILIPLRNRSRFQWLPRRLVMVFRTVQRQTFWWRNSRNRCISNSFRSILRLFHLHRSILFRIFRICQHMQSVIWASFFLCMYFCCRHFIREARVKHKNLKTKCVCVWDSDRVTSVVKLVILLGSESFTRWLIGASRGRAQEQCFGVTPPLSAKSSNQFDHSS